jgi:hypothetical protein
VALVLLALPMMYGCGLLASTVSGIQAQHPASGATTTTTMWTTWQVDASGGSPAWTFIRTHESADASRMLVTSAPMEYKTIVEQSVKKDAQGSSATMAAVKEEKTMVDRRGAAGRGMLVA